MPEHLKQHTNDSLLLLQLSVIAQNPQLCTVGACLLFEFCLLSRAVNRSSLLYYPNLPIMSLIKVNSLMVNDYNYVKNMSSTILRQKFLSVYHYDNPQLSNYCFCTKN